LLPSDILLVVDAMTGQEAVKVAEAFHDRLDLGGVILTKLDGDARGGAALSIRAVIDRPIKFMGVGEKIEDFEPFHPDRMASRILGMGDVLTLVEKAQETFDQKQVEKFEKKLKKNSFTLEDFRDQLQQIRKMGSLESLLSMIPGMQKLKGGQAIQPDERELVKVEAIINSMTRKERLNHAIINGSRRKRIARGSGTTVQDVNNLIKRYVQAKKMMKRFRKMGKRKSFGKGAFPFPM
jgi:signal recognition particle subunit SRP54